MTSRTPATNAPKRCAVYTRKSIAKGLEQEFNSLDAQRESCVTYIHRQPGWTLVETRYDDGGFSGATIERPAFQRLLADIEAGKVDIIVVYKIDRLSRSLLDFAGVMERLNNAGASFVSVTQNFSTADAMGRLTLNMLMSFAEFERGMIADRTRDKVAAARRKGKWTGGQVPFGYSVENKHLVVNELEAVIVREAFELLLQHRQKAVVARLLNEHGHWPRGAKAPNGKSPRWTKDSMDRLLRSPLYAGLVASDGIEYPGEHTGLVPMETFRRAQRILDEQGHDIVQVGLNPAYVLRGLLRCGQCGAAMSPGSTRNSRREYRYYRCSTRDKRGRDACAAPPLPAEAIESYVVGRIGEAAQDHAFVASVRDALATALQRRRAGHEATCRLLPSRIANLSAHASKLAEELTRLDGRSRDIVLDRLNVETEKLTEAERQLTEAQTTLHDLDGVSADQTWVTNALADFTTVWAAMTPLNQGRLLRALVERVVMDEATAKVEIHLIDLTGDRASEAA